ncbi:unnamed protein product [Didymodactylos carnosus]|nr:unnamed protein product [Didymodactylos carnosus]CAF4366662.1 unnamed protein product [Didymodactylos carnosus]
MASNSVNNYGDNDNDDQISNKNNEYLKTELVSKLLKHFLPDDKSSRLATDTVKLFTELLFLFITETIERSITQAKNDGSQTVNIEHIEKIFVQLLLDF